MRHLTLLILSFMLLASCLAEQKEKELPSYLCNENLERYFAGNDSLPLININPNDSFGVIRDITDSLEKLDDYFATYSFNTYIPIDSSFKPLLIRLSFAPNIVPSLVGVEKVLDFNKRNALQINVIGKSLFHVYNDTGDSEFLKKYINKFINNNGRDPLLSDNPTIGVVTLSISKSFDYSYFTEVIKNIVDAYHITLNNYSKKAYNKPYCNLNNRESKIISEIIPFKFIIVYTYKSQLGGKPSLLLEM